MGNDFSFDSVKANGFTNELTYRGPKQRSGVSYDYMDKLNQLVDQGIFVDKDGDGFTSAEKKALEDEFFTINQEKGYSTNFNKMLPGTKNDYSYDDFIRFAEAAGYVLKEDVEDAKPVEPKVSKEPDAVPEKAPVSNPLASADEVTVPTTLATPAEEGDGGLEPVSQSGIQTLNAIAGAGLSDGEYDIDFEGEKAVDANGNVVAEVAQGTVNGAEFKYVNSGKAPKSAPATDATVESAPETASAPKAEPTAQLSGDADGIKAYLDADPELAGKTGEERAQILRNRAFSIDAQIRELSSATTHTKRGFLGLGKKKTIVDKTAEQAQQENAAQIADLRVQRDNIDRAMVYAREVEGKYWVGKYSPDSKYDADGNILKQNPTYDRVTTSDGRRVARTSEYVRDDQGYPQTVYHYYPVSVEKIGNPKIGSGTYYSVIPDLDNELTDVESAK